MRIVKTLFPLSLLFFIILLTGCKTKNSFDLLIAPERADCVGVAPQKCLQVKKPGEKQWTFFYDGIEGFTFEPGFTYRIRVKTEERVNPPADASSVRYILIKQLSKKRVEPQ